MRGSSEGEWWPPEREFQLSLKIVSFKFFTTSIRQIKWTNKMAERLTLDFHFTHLSDCWHFLTAGHILRSCLSKISSLKSWPYFTDKDSATQRIFFSLCSCLFKFYVADYDSLIHWLTACIIHYPIFIRLIRIVLAFVKIFNVIILVLIIKVSSSSWLVSTWSSSSPVS